MSPLEELPGSKIDIYDESDGKTKKYHEIESERSFKTWDISSFGIFRIYAVSDAEREKLEPYAKEMIKNERSESVITDERSESVNTSY